jgi:hypothetical protein
MDRKEFLKNCAGAMCACMTGNVVSPASMSAADTPPAEDWRLRFAKERYGKLLEILSSRMDEDELNETLRSLGECCSGFGDQWIKAHRDDFDGLCRDIQQGPSGDTVTYDRENGIVTMTSPERTNCFCPLNGVNTPKVVCNCSLGWQQHTWGNFFQKKVKVELKESVLRGGKRCVFEIRILPSA